MSNMRSEGDASRESPVASRHFELRLPVLLRQSLSPVGHGAQDRTVRFEGEHVCIRAFWTPQGPATLKLEAVRAEGASPARVVDATAWGQGADWALDVAPDHCGASDSLEGFEPKGLVADLHHRFPGLRIIRAHTVFHCMVPAVLGQKVTGKEAMRAYGAMIRSWGTPAPGPFDLMLPPLPKDIAARPYFDWHPMGVERRRAEVLRECARRARRLEEAVQMDLADAHRRLRALPGIGPWTAAEVARSALGDADALSVGDYHLKNVVSYNLKGEARGTDEQMLELLEPYAGHRGRVQRLLHLGGKSPPKFGPRTRIHGFRG